MSYIQQNLIANEKILHRAIVSNAYVFLGPIITCAVGIIAGSLIGVAGGSIGAGLSIGFSFTLIFGLPLLVSGLIKKFTTEVALTNQRVILKWGFVERKTIEIINEKVEGISADQDIFGRLFGYGSITVRGTGSGYTPCPGIVNPQNFRRAVNEEIEKLKQSKTGSAFGASTGQRMGQPAGQAAPHSLPGGPSAAPSITPGVQFHVTNNGQQLGPFTVTVLQQMVPAGTFNAASLVWHPGLTGWQSAATVPELAGLFASAAPPPALTPPPPPVATTTTSSEPRATCIHCSTRIAFPPEGAGQEVPCPTCAKPLLLVAS